MSTHDKSGREYARLSQLQAGDVVELDSDFTCHKAGRTVLGENESGLFFICNEGNHQLDGQLAEDGDHLVGVYQP